MIYSERTAGKRLTGSEKGLKMGRKKAKRIKKAKKDKAKVYAFAIPVAMLLCIAASVLIWDHITNAFSSLQASSAGEVFAEVIRDRAVILTLAGIFLIVAASLAASVRAMKEKRPGAFLLTVLLIVTACAAAAIFYIALSGLVTQK